MKSKNNKRCITMEQCYKLGQDDRRQIPAAFTAPLTSLANFEAAGLSLGHWYAYMDGWDGAKLCVRSLTGELIGRK